MTSAALVPIDELADSASSWPVIAKNRTVASQEDCEDVAALLGDIKALRQEIAASTDPVIKAAHAAHKAAVKQKADLEAPLIEAEATLKHKVGNYAAEQQRKAREVAALAEAVAREAREKAEKEARALEAAGERELADAVREESAVESAPPIMAPPLKVAGITLGETWAFEVVDLASLVAAVAKGEAPLSFVVPNEVAIGGMARATKGTMQYPGVRIFSRPRVGTR